MLRVWVVTTENGDKWALVAEGRTQAEACAKYDAAKRGTTVKALSPSGEGEGGEGE